jgi:hypothetical protein
VGEGSVRRKQGGKGKEGEKQRKRRLIAHKNRELSSEGKGRRRVAWWVKGERLCFGCFLL